MQIIFIDFGGRMTKFLVLCLLLSATASAGNLQNADFATLAQITGSGGSVSQLLNTVKIYDNTNHQQLSTTIANLVTPSGTGTVTSVGVGDASAVPIYTITNSPITTSGIIGLSLKSQSTNSVFAGPGSGGSASPAFRSLVAADIPVLGYVSSVTGSAPVSSSGGSNPSISMAAATNSINGYLKSIDWNTFNNKQDFLTFVAGSNITINKAANTVTITGSSSGGSVSSVGIADVSTLPIYTITNSPITSSGTIGIQLNNQAQNSVFAGPTSGSGQPAFRAITASGIGYTPVTPSNWVNIPTSVNSGLDNLANEDFEDSIFKILNTSDLSKKVKFDVSGLSTAVSATISPSATSNQIYTIRPNVDSTANIITQNTSSGQIFIGADSTIGGANSGIQYSNATIANRGQIKLQSYFNGTSIAGVSTLTSRSGAVGVNAALVNGQDYSKWTAQAAAATAGSAPISGTFAFRANNVESLVVASDFHIQLTNQAGTLGDRFAIDSEGFLTLPQYTSGFAKFTAGGVVTPSSINLTSDVTGVLPVVNGGTGQSSYTDGQLLIGNTSGNTLTKATLSAGSGISITNGNGSISIAATGGGSGTVTSVGVADVSTTPIYTITNSPITSSGTIGIALNNQSSNSVFAGPTSGGSSQPAFRSLVSADLPAISFSGLTGQINVTQSTLPVVTPASLDLNWNAGTVFRKNIITNSSITFSNVRSGETIVLSLGNANIASVTWPTAISWSSLTTPSSTGKEVCTFINDSVDTIGTCVTVY